MRVESLMDVDMVAAQRTKKLVAGAHEFEGMMLEQMLKGLDFGKAPGDEAEAAGAGGTMQSYGTEALAKSIASGGGFGIAQRIVAQVRAQDDAQGKSSGGGKV